MKKKRLVHITSSLQMGGAERTLYMIVKYLCDQFDQAVICFHDGPFVQKLRDMDIKVVQVSGYFFRYDVVFFWRLYKALKDFNPDGVHALLWAANVCARMCAKMLGVPTVTVYHNSIEQDGMIRSFIDKFTLYLGQKEIAVSEHIARSIQKRDVWLPASRIEVINNGIEVPEVKRNITKSDLGLEGTFVIGAVGRFVSVKRFDLLLEACATIMSERSDVRLMLVGLGPQEAYLRKYAHDLGISEKTVFIVGKYAIDYYPLFDCFVQSSDKEGVSIALLEAMYFALPIIVMGAFYVHPVINHGFDGLVCPVGDMKALSACLDRVIDQHATIVQTLGKQAKISMQNDFQAHIMVHKYAKIFHDLCNKNTK